MSNFDSAICWLRRDLRLQDNAALALATSQSTQVAVVFVYDTTILDTLPKSDRRVTFIHQSLTELDKNLAKHGSRLVTLHGDPLDLIPKLAKDLNANHVFASHDDDPYAIKRDKAVNTKLDGKLTTCKDHVVLERQEVLNQSGEPYKVYTPYSKEWRNVQQSHHLDEHSVNTKHLTQEKDLKNLHLGNQTLEEIGFEETELWLKPGEKAAHKRLAEFLEEIKDYKEQRNFPALNATSGLSVHLRFGTISIRECFRKAIHLRSQGAITWVNELIWREFYHMILANFPHVGEGKAFRPDYEDIQWPGSDEHFKKWCLGQTGYPLVDAAMRCFNQTGWMHNRLRMVTAMFLTKDLLVDWRKGEQYFADNLLDFELASNNGGWQWSASTGVDAQPYFRIFNPVLQSLKFDPEGEFIKEWCPELKDLDKKSVHWPFQEDGQRTLETPSDWPDPLVIHKEQKSKALALFS